MPRVLKKILPVAGILATLGLFLVIATMQSRWLKQLSEADLRRRQLALEESLRATRNDLNREVTGAYGLFQLENSLPKESWGASTADYYGRWLSRGKFHKLVRRIFIVEPSRDRELAISVFNPETKKYDPSEWPRELSGLRESLKPPFPGVAAFGLHTFTGVVSPEAPVLIFPIGYGGRVGFSNLIGWQIIELDREYLLNAMLPGLLRSHVEHLEEFDYQITRNEPAGKLVYQSDPKAAVSTVDASVSILEMGQDYFPHGIGGPVPRHQLLFRENVDQPGRLPDRVGDGGIWRLQLRHRLGSLDAAVTRMYRGNLLLNFAMIGLVVLDLAILAVLARRIHRLGESKAEFAAAVSHELRTPIAAICSAADNLAAGVANEPARVQQYGAAILEQGKQLAEMVEQILTFASGESGRKVSELELEVADQVRQVIAAAAPAARAAGVEIRSEIAPDLPYITGDSSAIQQAIMNLLTNAIKYGRSGHWVLVSACRGAARELEIAVEDNGPGIPASEVKHIFEPFYRGFTAATLHVHGSGLGLTIVDRTARAHGGRVTVDSTPGRGSRFTLHLPTV